MSAQVSCPPVDNVRRFCHCLESTRLSIGEGAFDRTRGHMERVAARCSRTSMRLRARGGPPRPWLPVRPAPQHRGWWRRIRSTRVGVDGGGRVGQRKHRHDREHTWTSSGKYGTALVFNGSNAVVTVPDARAAPHERNDARGLGQPDDDQRGWRDVIYKGDDNYYLEATSTNGGGPPRD